MTRPNIARAHPTKPAYRAVSLAAFLASPDFVAVGISCAIGLLLALDAMLG